MRAGGAAWEAGDVTSDELALPVGRLQRRAAAKDDEPFLVRVMQVVRPELLSRVDVVRAPADELGAELRPDLGLSNPKALVLRFVAAFDGEDVGDPHLHSAADQFLERGRVADRIEVGVLLRHVATPLPSVDRLA